MEYGFRVILGIAALAVLAFASFRSLFSRNGIHRSKNSEETNQLPTGRDRELLELIGDLAELYRATGR